MPGIQTAFAQGLAANRPAAASSNSGYYWLSTDVNGGTLYQSTGSAWVQVAAGVSQAGFSNPMTTAGDLIVGTSAGAASRLGVGTAGQVLSVVSGAPAWAAATSGSGGILAQVAVTSLASDISAANSTTKWTDLTNPSVSITTGGSGGDHRLLCVLTGAVTVTGTSQEVFFALKVNTTYIQIGSLSTVPRGFIAGVAVNTPAANGAQTVKVAYYASSGGAFSCRPSSFPDNEEMRLVVAELTI